MATEYSQTSEIQTHTHTIGTKASAILDQSILDKVQKCLNRAAHTCSTELEAKAALFLAQKLMAQYNVTQVDMMAMTKDDDKAVDGKSTKAQTEAGYIPRNPKLDLWRYPTATPELKTPKIILLCMALS